MTSPDSIKSCQTLIAAGIKRECRVSVVIPIHNEAAYLPETLKCFARQIDWRERPLNPNLFEIIIFANNCTDESAAIARRWQKQNKALNVYVAEADLPPENSNIGFVRRLLMNEADRRLRNNNQQGGIIMTTDGDTCVAPNWIAANQREIKHGADAVGGRILINPAEIRKMDGKAKRFHLLDTGYRLSAAELEARLDYVSHDYLPRHHQHFNGSFAVTTDAFRRAGGVPDVRFLEDVAFYHSLLRVDARFRHSPTVRVTTSARRSGRTESGLSTQINEWTIMGQNADDYFVESAQSIERRICLRRRLRDLWNRGAAAVSVSEIAALAGQLFVCKSFLQAEFHDSKTFGGMLERVQHEQIRIGEWKKNFPLVTVEKALFDLRQTLETLRREKRKNNQSFAHTSSR
ncbi:MAG: glycosyltransferase [Pyrinomonadaceae bacterium]|nr:glycosyltransferase [Pyrinomonadaceae bacterium]